MASAGTPSGPVPGRRLGRRQVIAGGGLAVGGALAGAAGAVLLPGGIPPPGPVPDRSADQGQDVGAAVVPFHGPHQAGVTTPPQAHGSFIAFDLRPGVDRDALGRMMRLLTDDAARLCQGQAALADTEPELATRPARLTVTFGFGPALFPRAGRASLRPAAVAPLPPLRVDRLQERWSGGDLLVQVCADDPVTVAHAQRMLVKDARTFARVRWVQRGFRRAAGAQPAGTTQRNLMGQLDGTIQPPPDALDQAVWISDGPAWLRGGTTMVLRRIRVELDAWDAVDRAGKEQVIGRRLDTGAPLTGVREHDPPDLAATDPVGLPVIGTFAHVRRAHVGDARRRMLRRPYNYDDGPTAEGGPDAGLLFVAYQADIARQFLPVQRTLAEADLLNAWTTPIGSAVFAIPPGCAADGWIGQTLLA